jgi:ATP-binding cassette subfamily B protein
LKNTKLPDHIAVCFRARGVDTSKIVRYVKGDMDRQGRYVDQILAFDDKNFYILSGTERVEQVKGSKARLHVLFDASDFVERPITELGHLDTDQMVATVRLYSEKEGRLEELALASIGRTNAFEIFAKHFNRFTDNVEEKEEGPIAEEPDLFCDKCGMRYPDPNRKVCPKCISRMSITVRLVKLFFKYWPQLLMIVVFLGLTTLLNVVSPYLSTALIYDKVLAIPERVQRGDVDTLYFGIDLYREVLLVILGLLCVRIISHGLLILRSRYIAGVVPRVVYDMKMLIFGSMQRLGVGFYTSKQTGSLMTRVNGDANNVYHFFIDGIPYLFTSSFTFIGVLVIMFSISWKLTLLVFVSIPIIVLGYWLVMMFFRRLYHANWVYASRMHSLLSDALYGQRVIKAFTQEDSETERFAEYSTRVFNSSTKIGVAQNTVYPLIGLIMRLTSVVLLGAGSIMVIQGELSLGILMTFSVYMNMLFEPLGFFSNVANWWAVCVDSAQRIFEIIDAETDLPEADNPVRLDKIRGDFEVREVMFEYEPGRPVVRNMSLQVKAGQMLGIVGKTGAGKSTLVNLLARLYDPNEGSIYLDGHNLKDIATEDLRKNIGIVSQDIYLFIGSIADNIRYARPDATMDEVIAAAKTACAHDFIVKFPDGYETRVGAGGQGLSGGERQRISIARAVIQNPSILILDEATAAMDTETERNIQNSLAELQKGRTTIAIAHRLSTLRDADVLAVIDKGRVVEYGTHAELIQKEDGTYRRLYTLQMEALKFIGIGQ